MTSIFSWDYWFNTRPELLARPMVWALVVVGVACAYLIYFANIKQKENKYNKSLWYRLQNFAIANLALSWLMALFYHQGIPFFSAKFWLPLWLVLNGVYAVWFYTKTWRQLPSRLEKIKQDQEFKKYIPKKAK